MIEEQFQEMVNLIKDEDLRKYSGEAFWNFVQAIYSKDPFAGAAAINNIKELIFHMPTVIFWNKMRRFLFGTYKNYSEQVKMASKFNGDNEKYVEFVKKQVYLINEIDDDFKVDYFSSLSRCLLLEGMEIPLYFKLSKFLVYCTIYELEFIKNWKDGERQKNTAMISMLYQYGLFDQNDDLETSETVYELSSFGKALKSCCLNFDEDISWEGYLSYASLEPLNIPESISEAEIDQILDGTYPN